MTSIDQCTFMTLPSIASRRQGTITPIYNNVHIPFSIERVYYLYDVPAGSLRGGHAHRELQQVLVAASGSFDVVLRDGSAEKVVTLNRPFHGLYIPNMIWRELVDFSGGAICICLASLHYDESDYFRDYDEYLAAKRAATP